MAHIANLSLDELGREKPCERKPEREQAGRARSVRFLLPPQGRQHGDDLLFPGHDPGQKGLVVPQLRVEGLLEGVLPAYAQHLAALQERG